MPNVILTLDPSLEGKTKEEKSLIFDQEVQQFSDWLSTVSDFRAQGPLSRPEKALLKTYLVQKYTGKVG